MCDTSYKVENNYCNNPQQVKINYSLRSISRAKVKTKASAATSREFIFHSSEQKLQLHRRVDHLEQPTFLRFLTAFQIFFLQFNELAQ